jgi:hypothetical protein
MELNVNRKKKKIEFNVHYKKTNTNITIKKRSNHRESIKRGVIKGYSDRARMICDEQYLEEELRNVEEIFIENGYTRKEVREAMKEKEKKADDTEEEEKTTRGLVLIPNIPEFTTKFNNIARKHNFTVANKATNKVRDLASNAKTPLGDKNSNVVYNVPCSCGEYTYTGETYRKWETRRKEHQDKVRLTNADIAAGNIERATERMNEQDGGLAKHSTECGEGINWEGSRIMGRENGRTQRKMLEGVETIKQKGMGKKVLNTCNQMEQWQSTIYSFLNK